MQQQIKQADKEGNNSSDGAGEKTRTSTSLDTRT